MTRDEDDFDVGPLLVDADEAADLGPDLGPPELAAWAPPIRALTLAALSLLEREVPGHTARWVEGWRVYLVKTPPPAPRMFGYVAPLVDRVRLAIDHGALVPDPHGLFEPSSSRLHHRELRDERDLRHRGLPAVLRAAAALEPPRARTSRRG